MDARELARRVRAQVGEWTGAHRRSRARLDGRAAALLMYHRVLPRPQAEALAVEPGMFVTPETFARHLDCLQAEFRVLPLREVVDAFAEDRSLPRGACAITFDDGWRDNHDHALPELERRGLPATIFLVTERVGTSGAFWPDEVCRRVLGLGSSARQELATSARAAPGRRPSPGASSWRSSTCPKDRAPTRSRRCARARPRRLRPVASSSTGRRSSAWRASGIDFESHGATHALLPALPEQAVVRELEASRDMLRGRGFGAARLFAYASGAFDLRVREAACRAGYRAAVTTVRGLARAGDDLMTLSRIGLHDDVSRTRAEFLRLVPGRDLVASGEPGLR